MPEDKERFDDEFRTAVDLRLVSPASPGQHEPGENQRKDRHRIAQPDQAADRDLEDVFGLAQLNSRVDELLEKGEVPLLGGCGIEGGEAIGVTAGADGEQFRPQLCQFMRGFRAECSQRINVREGGLVR
ncbi:hypothetical protein [Actinocorallia aurea]